MLEEGYSDDIVRMYMMAQYAVMIGAMAVLYGGLGGLHTAHAAAESRSETSSQWGKPTVEAAQSPQISSHGAEEEGVSTPKIRLAEQSLKADIAAHKAKMTARYEALEQRKDGVVEEQKTLDAQWNLLKQKIAIEDSQKRLRHKETEQSVARLAHIYEQMPPREAAYMFNILDMRAMLPVAQHMLPRKLSDIMGKMAPERANVLSQYLAGRRKIAYEQPQFVMALAKYISQK